MSKGNGILAAIIAFSWTILVNQLTIHFLGDSFFYEVIGTLCGISFGICIGWGTVILGHKVKSSRRE